MSLDFLLPDWPAPGNVRAFMTTRAGGASLGPYASLNLGDHTGDDAAAVAQNRSLLRVFLPDEPCWLKQVHGNAVCRADDPASARVADAAVARQARTVCSVLTADCLPVLLCDGGGGVVAAAHAGWRGLAGGVLEATIKAMNTPPRELLAWLGAAIGADAFQVGEEVREAFVRDLPACAAAFRADPAPGKWRADIYRLARLRLARAGVTRVFGGGLCTATDAARFYSYRRDGASGRMAACIWRE